MQVCNVDISTAPKPKSLYQHPHLPTLKWLIDHPDLVNAIDADHKKKVAAGNEQEHIKRIIMKRSSLKILTMLLAKYNTKGVLIHYKHAKGSETGREYVDKGLGMELLPKLLRELLSVDMKDLDIENAAPTILSQLCRYLGIPCPFLDEYNSDRKGTLAKLAAYGVSLKDGKSFTFQMMFGGGFKVTSGGVKQKIYDEWYNSFHAEMKHVRSAVSKVFPSVLEGKSKDVEGLPEWLQNPEGKTLANIIFRIENLILNELMVYFKNNGLKVEVKMFDGLQSTGELSEGLLEKASDAIWKKTGFRVKIVEKPIAKHDHGALLAKYAIPAHTQKGQSEYLQYDLYSVAALSADYIGCGSGMSMGKTERAMEFIKPLYLKGKSILIVCQRVTMVRCMALRTGQLIQEISKEHGMEFGYFDSYDDEQVEYDLAAHNNPYLIVEYESLHRIEGSYDYIICDEFRSLASTIVASTNRDNIEGHWNTFKHLTASAQKVLFMCADMCVDGAAYEVMDMLMKHRKQVQVNALLEEIVRVEGDGKDSSALLRSVVALRKDAQHHCKICDKHHSTTGICKIENNCHKLRRDVQLVSPVNAIGSIVDEINAGQRIGIACGSVKAAHILKDFLLEKVDKVDIGIYTSRTDNRDDFYKLTENWDKYQVIIFTSTLTTGADYNTEIDSVYAFPCLHTCCPRDMHQMVGRFRKVKSCTVNLVVSQVVTHDDIPTRAKVDCNVAHYKDVLFKGSALLNSIKRQKGHELRFTVGSVSYNLEYTPSLSELLTIRAYNEAERSYTLDNASWTKYFLYMSQLKGYNISFESAKPTERRQECYAEFKDFKEKYFSEEQKAFPNLDVARWLDPLSIDLLQQLSKGAQFQDSDKLVDALSSQFGMTMTKRAFRVMAHKAEVQLVFPNSDIDLPLMKAYDSHQRTAKNYLLLEQTEHQPDTLLKLRADFVMEHSSSTGLQSAHSFMVIHIVRKLFKLLKLPGIRLNRKIDLCALEDPEFKKLVLGAQELNVCSRRPVQKVTLTTINSILSSVGLQITKKFTKLERLDPVDTLLDAYETGGSSLLSNDWFEAKWKKHANLNQFLPYERDDEKSLQHIVDEYRYSKDPEMVAFRDQVQEVLSKKRKISEVNRVKEGRRLKPLMIKTQKAPDTGRDKSKYDQFEERVQMELDWIERGEFEAYIAEASVDPIGFNPEDYVLKGTPVKDHVPLYASNAIRIEVDTALTDTQLEEQRRTSKRLKIEREIRCANLLPLPEPHVQDVSCPDYIAWKHRMSPNL